MQKVKPLKKFGQNYLTDNNILNKIAEEFDPKPGENIIEIGPGTGALTEKLYERIPSFHAVEIDTRVTENLTERFPGLKIIRQDFLKISLNNFLSEKNEKLRIIGNIPYNLTSPIIFKMIEENEFVNDAVLMVQLEVAQRMTAKKGSKDYGILAVILNHFTKIEISFKVSPNVFYPKPKVFSAVIHIYFKENSLKNSEKKFFIQIVKAAFGNRRKTLKNSLSNSIFGGLNFAGSGVDLSLRAEQLDEDDFIKLALFARDNSEAGFFIK
jgi:16S rRNA (adenine1518-N6/adenine1519-N6)-dimethyltransferase